MVKHSPENRSGELYRNGFDPPKPPPNLGKPERELWASIVKGLPPDWFSAAAEKLLLRFVRTSIFAERLHNELEVAPIGTPESSDLLRQVLATNACLGVLAAKLRINPQVTVSARSTGRLAERGSPVFDDPLLAGRWNGLRAGREN